MNNLIMYADPSGHFVITVVTLLALGKSILIGGLIATGTAYAVDVVTN